MKNSLTLGETIFIAILATAMGIAWWAYSFFYNIVDPLLKTIGLSGLLDGFWQLGGIFFGYIIRKPGSALIGATVAATVEGLISQWGFSALVSGLCQGLPVELLFLACHYKIWNRYNCALAGALSALGGFIVSYYWYGYSAFSLKFIALHLGCSALSGAIIGGLGARYLARRLCTAGVLNHYRISHEQ